MKGKEKGGLSNIAIGIIWALVVVGGVLAVLQQLNIDNPGGGLAYIREKSAYYLECIPAGDCGLPKVLDDVIPSDKDIVVDLPNLDNGFNLNELLLDREKHEEYKGPEEDVPYVNNAGLVNKKASLKMLKDLVVVSDSKNNDVDYSRSEWKHWTGSEDRKCWNTREEMLYRQAKPGSVKLINKNKENTEEYLEACAIGTVVEKDGKIIIDSENSGIWIDPYSGVEFTNARDLDIDHIIPLSNAARNGGQNWSAELKEQFANDPDNLLVSSAKENRSKGAKGPGEYMPLRKANYNCQYAKAYTTVAYKYSLTINEADFKILEKSINSCKN